MSDLPDEAVEAAVQAWRTGSARRSWERMMSDSLEAAAPFLVAKALRDAAQDAEWWWGTDSGVARTLRARADRLGEAK